MKTNTQNPISVLLHNRESAREKGIYSCCSANAYVIRAALRRAKAEKTVVLVEATANQVNQNGGYTGMTPEDFRHFLNQIATEEGVSSKSTALRWRPSWPPYMAESSGDAGHGQRRGTDSILCLSGIFQDTY